MRLDDDEQTCDIEGCARTAAYQVLKLPNEGAEQERFFCYDHGIEFANRAHLVISDTI